MGGKAELAQRKNKEHSVPDECIFKKSVPPKNKGKNRSLALSQTSLQLVSPFGEIKSSLKNSNSLEIF